MKDNESELKNIVEAALLAAEEPLSLSALTSLFPEDAAPPQAQLKDVLDTLDQDYEGRGVELKRVGKGWRFQSREKYSPWLRKLTESRPPRYSRAFLETLAIVAYRQPVTRGDIEEIRGVQVSSDIMRSLVDRDWVKEVGHRDVPGRPALLGTTQQFLEYFNIESLSELPPLLERREASDIARELNLRLPLEREDNPVLQQGGQEQDGDNEADSEAADAGDRGAEPRVATIDGALTGEASPDGATDEPTDDAGQGESVDEAESEQAGRRMDHTNGDETVRSDGETSEARDSDGEESEPRPTAQVIPFDDALSSREGDGEDT